ncbi:unnamed protein product [Amaranthus hypochondriacus]
MTFWGVEVKPGKPYTFNTDELGGKLILTQATLGIGSATKKSILQVKIGDKSPVYLCTLLPDKLECCSLNLEFEEDDAVVFSVVGPTSIHLSGFVHGDYEDDDDDDSDSYGEDIDESESESSGFEADDDLDAFLNEDESMFPPSSAPKSGVVIEEIVDDEKATSENAGTKQSKKKKQSADSNNEKKCEQQIVVKGTSGTLALESEDEDGFPVSLSRKSETNSKILEAKTTTGTTEGKKTKKKKIEVEEAESVRSLKRKVESVDKNDEQKSDAIEAGDGDASVNKKKDKKKKKAKTEKNEEVADLKKDASNKDEKQTIKPEKEAKKSNDKHAKVRTFPNGLAIEELKMGQPDGKRASRGSKVSVHYIGKLLKTGKHFDSNIGRKPFKFRLGIGQVIKGWDVGVEGMRVGDKRRLTIPPSMGYGAAGAPPQIPSNAWLLFDVELVDVA